jgi:hypothetical protein
VTHVLQVDIGKDGSAGLPFKAELFDVKSDFAQVSIYADTTKLDATLRPWLELYKDIGMELRCMASHPYRTAAVR